MYIELLAAATNGQAAPVNQFGFVEALEQGGVIAWSIFAVLVIMSVGSFYILITKWIEQQKIMNQYKQVRSNFWRANSLREGAGKLDKNSAWRQLVDDGLSAEESHGKMTDAMEAHDWLHGSLARSEASINAKLAGGLPWVRPPRSSVCSVRLSASTARSSTSASPVRPRSTRLPARSAKR